MPQPAQATRHIAIETPLGEDVLLLQSFSGHEELSRLSEFNLDLLSENYEINFDDIIGQNVSIRMDLPEGGTRYWNGFVSRFVQGVSTSVQFAQYRATMVPWLWFLTQTSDCRIFQEKTVPEIIRQVFSDHGFSDIEDRLSGGYRVWSYCVQYRETDYNFVSRLMEQEGIYYFFLHEQGKCTLVLCDSLSRHDPYENYGSIDFAADTRGSAVSERITEWTVEKKVRSGKFAHIDYNFEKPGTSLMSIEEDQKSHARSDYEIYDYPGEYLEKADGDRYARMRLEELSYSHEICTGRSDVRGISTGFLFTLNRHTRRDQNREYLVISTGYQAAAQSYETSGGSDQQCNCFFSVIPASVQFRPERVTPKPMIQGSQTAIVVGPPGEEIHTDEHGRVKVQFHWDREGSRNQNSSCWIRVSQMWAGAGWGAMYIPRIGQEVIVDFLEGDPDRPIITGRIYHGENRPPYPLPDERTKSTIKSNSSIGGGGSNEIRFEDKKGAEEVYIHAQHNMNTVVENDQKLVVHRDRTVNVDQDTTEQIGRHKSGSVQGNREVTINGYDTESVQGSQTLNVGGAQSITIGGKQTIDVQSDQTVTISSTRSLTIEGSATETIGGSKTITVGGSQTETITGSFTLTGAGLTLNASGPVSISASVILLNSPMVSVSGAVQCTSLITSSVVSSSYTPGVGNIW